MELVSNKNTGKTKKRSMFWEGVKNWFFVYCMDNDVIRIFQGYWRRKLSVEYANKRFNNSQSGGLSGGKRYYVLTFADKAYIVCNRKEIISLKAKGIFKPNYNIENELRNAFYITK
jgi:hypothetical protein